MADDKKKPTVVDSTARKAANEACTMIRKLRDELFASGALPNPAATMSGADVLAQKKGNTNLFVLICILIVSMGAMWALAEALSWSPFDTAVYGTATIAGNSSSQTTTITADNFVGAIAGAVTGDVTTDDINMNGGVSDTLGFNDTKAASVTGLAATVKFDIGGAAIDTDYLNFIMFQMDNDSSESIDWAYWYYVIDDNTTNTEDSAAELYVQVAGTATKVLDVDASGLAVVGDITASGNLTGLATNSIVDSLTVNGQVDINLGATTDEVDIDMTNTAGTASTPLIGVNDDRTGATANEASEATLWIDAEGTYAIGILDGAVAIESAIDTYAAGTMTVGPSDATRVEVADAAVITDIEGPVVLSEEVNIVGTALSVTNGQAVTVAQGCYILSGINGGNDTTNTITLAAPSAAGDIVYLIAATATTNLIAIADAGTVAASGGIELDFNDTAVLMAVDGSTWCLLSESDN